MSKKVKKKYNPRKNIQKLRQQMQFRQQTAKQLVNGLFDIAYGQRLEIPELIEQLTQSVQQKLSEFDDPTERYLLIDYALDIFEFGADKLIHIAAEQEMLSEEWHAINKAMECVLTRFSFTDECE